MGLGDGGDRSGATRLDLVFECDARLLQGVRGAGDLADLVGLDLHRLGDRVVGSGDRLLVADRKSVV